MSGRLCLWKETTLHLVTLKNIFQFLHHFPATKRSAYNFVLSSVLLILVHKTQSSVNRWILLNILHGRSLIYIKKRRGPRTVPCVTLERTGCVSEDVLLTNTNCFLLVRKSLSHANTSGSRLNCTSLAVKWWCETLSNAFSKSRNMASVLCIVVEVDVKIMSERGKLSFTR